MKRYTRIFVLVLSVVLSIYLCPTVFAAESPPAGLMDPEEVAALVEEFRQRHGLNEANFALAYCYTGTGEFYYYNEDTYYQAASLFKLPMMMCLMEEVSSGELTMADTIGGVPIPNLLEKILVYSNNPLSEVVVNYYHPFEAYRAMLAQLAEIPAEDLPEDYYLQNVTSARFMMNVLVKLYESPETYPQIIDHLKLAQPGEYFRVRLEDKYPIAQKYGSYVGDNHAAGIIYTPTPFLLVVMTELCNDPRLVIAEAAEMMAEYTLTLDERQKQHQAEKAAAAEKAEQERLAEEARIQAEQEAAEQARLEALEQERIAREEAERKQAEELRIAQEAKAKRILQTKILGIGILSFSLIIGVIVTVRKMKHT